MRRDLVFEAPAGPSAPAAPYPVRWDDAGMRNARRVLGIVFVLSAIASWTAMPAAAQTAEHAIVELRIDGVVDPFVANYVRGGRPIDRRDAASVASRPARGAPHQPGNVAEP